VSLYTVAPASGVPEVLVTFPLIDPLVGSAVTGEWEVIIASMTNSKMMILKIFMRS
jgi:hypothetical protein